MLRKVSKFYPVPAAPGRVAGPSSKGARRNASRHGGQMPWVVDGRTAEDSGRGPGPGSTTPHQAHTRIHAGEDSPLVPIACPAKVQKLVGRLCNRPGYG